jgi:hypothetical protein
MLEAAGGTGLACSYMVECYLPGQGREQAEAAMLGLRASATTRGRFVRCVASVLVPSDEAVFHFFDASSEQAVLDVCADAQLAVERIVEVVAVGRGDSGGFLVPQADDAA